MVTRECGGGGEEAACGWKDVLIMWMADKLISRKSCKSEHVTNITESGRGLSEPAH